MNIFWALPKNNRDALLNHLSLSSEPEVGEGKNKTNQRSLPKTQGKNS